MNFFPEKACLIYKGIIKNTDIIVLYNYTYSEPMVTSQKDLAGILCFRISGWMTEPKSNIVVSVNHSGSQTTFRGYNKQHTMMF